MASSIVTRVMSMIYINNFTSKGDKGKVVITAGANEFHEIGAWMISDLLEMNGWDVYYLGSNTPESDLYQMLLAVQPHILVISVTMFFNLSSAAFVIRAIKQNPDIQNIKILLGGAAVKADPDLTKKLGADATADHAVEALKLVNDLAPQTGA
ncbi:MAG: cobalamin-dependent protein [candidate division KSB1 bacterium]|nr:cobalamin-dependent protein [candidate division KSB1 bacterium]